MLERILKSILRNKLVWGEGFVEALAIISGSLLFTPLKNANIIGVILLIICIIFSCKNKKSLSRTISQGKRDKTRNKTLINNINNLFEIADDQDQPLKFYENLITHSLEPILKRLEFLHDPLVRVSLYCHSKDKFILLYRHSDDPEFKKKGRAFYPDNEGVIGAAYHKNKCYIENLPDPNNDEKGWIEAQMSSKVGRMKTKASVTNLTMKSRNIFALPIRRGHQKHMIIVFESLSPTQLKERKISKVLNDDLGINLREDLDMYREYIGPSFEDTTKLGM
ncbi:MAG: hypothetical protein COT84_08025 [Chlamydiae bacterium CG10_big_fil_rev_8_21_14_0_10_35_9]|nr:MAG: hypothetical protein COT84_08025 [Chlamydiae bacterium CG10_big_fil_rev_8_21_14_0_10_35_9]